MLNQYITFDLLSAVMLALVWTIGGVALIYSKTYMKYDRHYPAFMWRLVGLIGSLSLFFLSNHLVLSIASMMAANCFLVSVMGHAKNWREAKASAFMAFKAIMSATFFYALAGYTLALAAGSVFISDIVANTDAINTSVLLAAGLCLTLATMLQAGLWPFHSWLISSLNSPTPVSALMHAGLVNAGGFLLIRYSPIFIQNSLVTELLFAVGCISAILGTALKLVQSDVKRQYACSTMGQMGFMVMLIGLGLLPIALVHLVWHALFKANLFLTANQSIAERKFIASYPKTMVEWVYCLALSFIATLAFYHGLNMQFALTSWVVVGAMYLCVAFQLGSLTLTCKSVNKFAAVFALLTFSYAYGWYIAAVEGLFAAEITASIITLGALHYVAIAMMMASWLLLIFRNSFLTFTGCARLQKRIYVWLINFGQPDAETITTGRMSYKY